MLSISLCYSEYVMVQEGRKLWYLRRLNLFDSMSGDELEAISAKLRDRTCHRGETILAPYEPNEQVFLVKSGAVRIFQMSSDGREITVAILRPGQLFGTSALTGIGKTGTFAQAFEEAYVCEASAEEFLRIMSAHPLLAARITISMARQLLRMERQLEQLAFQAVPSRLAQALLQLAEESGGELPARLTHEDLAKLAGTTRATVTKVLSEFAEEGIVEVGYRRLILLDKPRLQRLGGLEDQ